MVYRAQTGLDLSNGKRVEAGWWVAEDEIPKRAVTWLLRRGHIVHEPDDRTEPEPEGDEES